MAEPRRPAGPSTPAGVRRGLALLLAVLAALGWLLPAAPAAAADEEPVVETVLTVAGTPEPDGRPVDLDVTLMTTDPTVPRPALVLAHGFGGSKDDLAPVGRALARAGYSVLTATARGFGASGGLIHLDDPAYEGADAVRLVDLLAGRPEVQRSGDDPVVGFAGASYGGALALLAAGLDPRVDAIAPAFTWNSLRTALFPQSAVPGPATSLADVAPPDAGVFKQRWAALFFRSGADTTGAGAAGDGPRAGPAALCGRFAPELCRGYLATAESGRPDADLVALLDRIAPQQLLSRVSAPTLLVQGEQDTLFGLDQADATVRGLPAGTPSRVVWVPGGHDASIDVEDQLGELEAWFGRHLRGDGSPAAPGLSAVVPQTVLVGEGDDDEPLTLQAAAYPGRGAALATEDRRLDGGRQQVLAPAGGTPAALTSLPGTGPALAAATGIAGYGLGVLPGQAATFTTAPLDAPLRLLGSGRVALEVTSTATAATLFASVWDLGPDAATSAPASGGADGRAGGPARPSSAVLPGAAVAPLRLTGLTPGEPRRVEVALPAVAHQVPVGHRLQVVVSSTDQAYAVPRAAALHTVALAGEPVLTLPRLEAAEATGGGLDEPLPLVAVVAGLVVAALAIALVLGRRGAAAAADRADLAALPLAVDGLVKTYGDGFTAVDGVSFTAGPGQVVGLLGPNGAGKTTTMRMLVGLIRPDAGAVYVGGRPVLPGAAVLGAVGAFIEGPGFLPHLTGRQNLEAYWRATGRPAEEAHLDEALEVAALGAGLDRRVRGYSQGMRQRLGIAQAMLGRPRLLLLDEPTNGLDPPQILAMRGVLADYAATGRTVLVSSHLLGEVQATCSHVVVMDRGRVVLAGPLAELTASDDATLVGLAAGADRATATAVLQELGLVVTEEDGLLRVQGDRPRAEVVAALVGAGVGVEQVDGRRRLEEVFMGLVGGGPGEGERTGGG